MSRECESKAGKGQEKVGEGQEKAEKDFCGDTCCRRLRRRLEDGVRGARRLHIAEGGDQRRRVPAEAAATAGRL